MSARLALVMLLAPKQAPWAPLRALAGVDLRVLGASIAIAALLGLAGIWVGWRDSS